MPLRIGFDLDGVLADMESELVRQAESLFGELPEPPPAPPAPSDDAAGSGEAASPSANPAPEAAAADPTPTLSRLQLTARQQRRLWRHVAGVENFWETLHEIEPGVIARLGGLAAERKWEIIFLTKRPESAGSTAQVQTQRWLQAKGFPLPSVFVVQGSRGRSAAALALDFVIDDRPENCLDVVVDSKARAVLVWRDQAEQHPMAARRLGIGVVKTVAECLDILVQVDSPDTAKPGVMQRVMRLLGLKEAAGA